MLKRIGFAAVALAVASTGRAADNPNFALAAGQIMPVGMQEGELTCVGGEPTGLPFPALPCTEGTHHIFIRGEQQNWAVVPGSLSGEAASLVDGAVTFILNGNLSADYIGQFWGTFEWTVAGVGTWQGSWTGWMNFITWETRMTGVGFGSGGAIEGKQLKFDATAAPGDWYIAVQARIH
jgi:hypothetical protein